MAILAASAMADDFGPLEIRNFRSVSIPFLRIDPRPDVLGQGERSLSLGFTAANDIRKLYVGGVAVVDEDYEIDRLLARYRVGLGHELDATFDLPILDRSGGFLDPLVSAWHRFVLRGYPSQRDGVPYGQIRVLLPGNGPYGSAFGIGDLSASLSRRLTPRLMGTVAVKLPTGDAHKILGSGAVDSAVALQYRTALGPRWTVFVQAGAVAQGSSTELRNTRPLVHQEAVVLTCRANSRDEWVAQWQGEASSTETGISGSDAPHRLISFGFHRKLSERQMLELFFSEDRDFLNIGGLTGVGPDFTAGVRVVTRF
ncbi:DUF3187 family protein [Fimbriimonas ginsengisoli]|uniref:Uncharacterized protein n=1 Tax=Fimbriimonas ginsengisoli Gsoil 348 TaxID=661478 RepID=A0A068NT30_FIMGI|nr:DUF3187 family protein [Fimbriimonas ginsengisoli]AIE86551.1 hypothetical protein OP10G_3183 [Fimbriimonas ginsengisoli Gsoil 348]